jgi:hypothetical protein
MRGKTSFPGGTPSIRGLASIGSSRGSLRSGLGILLRLIATGWQTKATKAFERSDSGGPGDTKA